ncbi:DUF1127 domain-containing protein [Celeribacter sp.]|uniref:DUF1127 domain-containing protein n=1 Tax=Celeribacter sp. TaxID=1890673 RepID=UPI003A925213
MAFISSSRAVAFGQSPSRVLLDAVLAPLRRWSAYRVTYRALARLDDQMLNDIGLARGQIETLSRTLASNR